MTHAGVVQRGLLRILGGPEPSTAHRASFVEFAAVGDPLADALVHAMKRDSDVRRQFEEALAAGLASVPDAGPELRAFFQHVETVPVWLNQAALDRAVRIGGHLGTWLLPIFLVGFAATYTVPQANGVLLRTGDTRDKAGTRAAETLAWVWKVAQPGALAPGADGFKACVQIRVLHAFIRSGILKRADWDVEVDGFPVNQGTYASVIVALSMATTFLSMGVGVFSSSRSRRAGFHLWRYVAHLSGVAVDLAPVDERDTLRLLRLYQLELSTPDHTTLELGSALIDAYPVIFGIVGDDAGALRRQRRTTGLHSALAHLTLGRETARGLGFPAPGPGYLRLGLIILRNAGFGVLIRMPLLSRPLVVYRRRAQARLVQDVCVRVGADLSFDRSKA